MPADPVTIAQLRAQVRAKRHALFALGEARRADLLRDRINAGHAAPIKAARANLRTARQALAAALQL